jgi:hypothetical protein
VSIFAVDFDGAIASSETLLEFKERRLPRRSKRSKLVVTAFFQSDDGFSPQDTNPRFFVASISRVIRLRDARSGSKIFSAVSTPATDTELMAVAAYAACFLGADTL